MEGLNVTRDVITDLLPIYESGEASQDTQGLVQEFLAKDPEFGRLVARLNSTRMKGLASTPSPDVEMKSLKRTRHLMKQQTSIMAVAIVFSLAPFIFTFDGSGITWLLIRDAPVVGCTWLLSALVLWIIYVVMRRKLKVL